MIIVIFDYLKFFNLTARKICLNNLYTLFLKIIILTKGKKNKERINSDLIINSILMPISILKRKKRFHLSLLKKLIKIQKKDIFGLNFIHKKFVKKRYLQI